MGRWQFSVRGLFFITLLVAMAIALGVTGQRLHRAEAQLDQYRREYGLLEIDDPTTLCAIARWTPEPKCWRWRVWFPRGRYKVCYAAMGILADGIPKPQGGVEDDFDGLTEVSATVFRDKSDGDWKCALSAGSVTAYRNVPSTLDGQTISSSGGVLWKQDATRAGPENRLVLLRHRVGKKTPSGGSILGVSEPSEGLMIWIEYQGTSTGRGSFAW